LDVKDGYLTITAAELDRPRQTHGNAPPWLLMDTIRRPPGETMQTKPGGLKLGLKHGVGRDVIGRRRCPALRIIGGDDREVGRPISRQRLTPEDGLGEETSVGRIHPINFWGTPLGGDGKPFAITLAIAFLVSCVPCC
jgi:hypothetical protein